MHEPNFDQYCIEFENINVKIGCYVPIRYMYTLSRKADIVSPELGTTPQTQTPVGV